ncbi:MAG TPA: hypothetical protein VKU89_01185 [Solirubrobacteraceae bacterium]|nr:hypothetical protein [Solirubrobacteraceae bacterium]
MFVSTAGLRLRRALGLAADFLLLEDGQPVAWRRDLEAAAREGPTAACAAEHSAPRGRCGALLLRRRLAPPPTPALCPSPQRRRLAPGGPHGARAGR